MADITVTLLTPISIRLTWTGSGDFEVWWKSDHPAGQEYSKLALVTGTSYDVGSLSWTTTYYFKVRQVGGEFGSEVHIFICCGQAVVLNPPGPGAGPPSTTFPNIDYWQQAIDVYGDNVVFIPLNQNDTEAYIIIYNIPTDTWTYKAQVDATTYEDYLPIQLIRDRVSSISRSISKIWIGFWNGITQSITEYGKPEDMGFFLDWQDTTYNENGRVVATAYAAKDLTITMVNKVFDQTDPSFAVYSYDLYINNATSGVVTVYLNGVSYGTYPFASGVPVHINVSPLYYGNSYTLKAFVDRSGSYPDTDPAGWTNEMTLDLTLGQGHATASTKHYVSGYYNRMYVYISDDNGTSFSGPTFLFEGYGYGYFGMCENTDNIIWFIVQDNTELVTEDITYHIYKYVVGSEPVLVKTISTDTTTFYGDYCKISAQGNKIVAVYTYLNPGNQVTDTATFGISVSNDNGATWDDRTIDGYASGLDYKICVSGDNIIMYCWSLDGTFHLLVSTDDGVSWTDKWDYTGYFQDHMEFSWLRSDGDTVVWAGCNFSASGTNPLGFLLSLDAGITWAYKECALEDFYQVLAPA